MNGIVVPKEHKYLLRRDRQTTEDYRPVIRSLILKKGSKEYITNQDFAAVTGTSSPQTHIAALMKQGFITRKPLRGHHGRRYGYTWHDEPLSREDAILGNGGVVTRSLNLPQLPIDDLTLERLGGQIFEWMSETDDIESRGVVRFHVWLTNKLKGVKAEREAILKGGK